MNRSFVSALLSLACLSAFPALAQSTGSAPATVTFSVGGIPTTAGIFTGTVQPALPLSPNPFPRPGGTITFFDGNTALNPGGAVLTAAGYASEPFSWFFDPQDAINPTATWQDVAGEFVGNKGSTMPDFLIYSTDAISNTLLLEVFQGNSGEFAALPQQRFPFSPQSYPSNPAVMDVDGDGKLDLLIGNTVVYGNGDGTFSRVAVLPILATGFNQTYAVDVNGDGKLDIVAVNKPPNPTDNPGTVQFMFTVFRNDGGGTFTSLGSFPLAPSFQTGVNLCCALYNVFGLSFGDVNGDGKPDILSQSNSVPDDNAESANQFNVMLNNGDGTFGGPTSIDTAALRTLKSTAIALGDLNNDGKNDLVLAYADVEGKNYLGAALGNGDGTFGAFSQLLLINGMTAGIANPQVQVIDFNVDAKLDAILGSGELALGNGDGTFSLSTPLFPQPASVQTPLNYPLLQMPIYTGSLPSLVYLNFTNGANAVFTPQDSSSATLSPVLSAGSHVITIHYSGDSTYAPAVSSPATITVVTGPAATSLTLTSSANPSYVGQNVTFTATIAGLTPGGGGTVTFSNGSTTLGTVTVSNGSASYTTTFSSPGNQTITAAYSGDANDSTSSGTVNQAVDAPLTVGATSGGSTSLTVTSGQSATTKVAVSGVGGFSGTVTFSCTGLPAKAACSFSPASMMVSGTAAATTTLTLSTGAATMSAKGGEPLRPFTVFACGSPLLGVLMLVPVARGRRLLLCVGFLLFVSTVGLTGCGGNSSNGINTPAGSYTFHVVATSGNTSATANYALTVK